MRVLRKLVQSRAVGMILAALLVGVGIGWLLPFSNPFFANAIASDRGAVLYESNESYRYIDPLLACDIGSQGVFVEFAPLKKKLSSLIDQKITSGDAEHISVYMRSVKSGRWFDINSSETYAPASLLKVFVMMTYYKEADETDEPSRLQQKVRFEASANSEHETPGETIPHLQIGKLYTIHDIIRQMIIYSDNDALNTLLDNFDPQTLTYFNLIFKNLNIPSPVTQDENTFDFMTVDQYAMVFRVLFGTTFLSERYSEDALTLLTQAHYKGGLAAGIPDDLAIAHKFGVTTVPGKVGNPSANELHDCGIIYYPNHPYLLCIMTQGQDFAKLQLSIKDISTAAYQWLDVYFKSLPPATPTAANR